MRLSLPLLAAVVGLGFPGLQCAYADSPPAHAAGQPVFEHEAPPPAAAVPHLELVDDAAQVLPAFEQGGRQYVLGQMGQRYEIRVVNPTGSRIEAVVSVDGLDAVDGRPGSLSKRGYIVPAYGEVTIDGFRTSLDAVAAFRFSSVRDSYASRTRHARNVGVVGAAFFRERPPVVRYAPYPVARAAPSPQSPSSAAEDREESPSPPAKSASGAAAPSAARPGLGTQFGEAHESHVVETAFVRADASPMIVSEVRYDDRDGLLSRGIQLSPPARDPRDAENDLRDTAQPFPESRFAQPPR
jgi:hypothetical protein